MNRRSNYDRTQLPGMHDFGPHGARHLQETPPRVPSSRYRVSPTPMSIPSDSLIPPLGIASRKRSAISTKHSYLMVGGWAVGASASPMLRSSRWRVCHLLERRTKRVNIPGRGANSCSNTSGRMVVGAKAGRYEYFRHGSCVKSR